LVRDAALELEQAGARALGYCADITDKEAVDRVAAEVLEDFGCVDILVNNAGGSFGLGLGRGPLLEVTPDDFDGA